MTGMELGDDDLVRLLDVSTWRSRRDELLEAPTKSASRSAEVPGSRRSALLGFRRLASLGELALDLQ